MFIWVKPTPFKIVEIINKLMLRLFFLFSLKKNVVIDHGKLRINIFKQSVYICMKIYMSVCFKTITNVCEKLKYYSE